MQSSEPLISRVELSAPQRKVYRVYHNDTLLFEISENTLVHFALRKGMRLSASAVEEIIAYQAFDECLQQALRYLNVRPHLERELRAKLYRKNYTKEIIDKVVDHLRDRNYLNDAHYVTLYIDEAVRSGKYGPLRIRQKLLQKGADRALIDEALGAFGDDLQKEICFALARKKKASLLSTDETNRKKKLGAFLQNKGFYLSTIQEVLNKIT